MLSSRPHQRTVTRRIAPEQRSHMMASVKKKNTSPEITVRCFLHGHGLRFILHDKRLPGTPDLVFPQRRMVLFVHGCFWHRCPHCSVGKQEVRSNLGYWVPKLARNQARDAKVQVELAAAGWRVLVIWECQTADRIILSKIASIIKQRRL
jgi:DNA mismatch endonuclease (patch repair protein)